MNNETYILTLRCLNCVPNGKPFNVEIPKGMSWQDYRGGFISLIAGYGDGGFNCIYGSYISHDKIIKVLCPYCGSNQVVSADGPLEECETSDNDAKRLFTMEDFDELDKRVEKLEFRLNEAEGSIKVLRERTVGLIRFR